MSKILYSILGIIAVVIAVVAFSPKADTGLLEDIKVTVAGHTQDALDRVLKDDAWIAADVPATDLGFFDEEADGQDSAHWAKGTVLIIETDGKRYVQLSSDFNSGPLPDGHVYVSIDSDVNNEADFNLDTQIDLGKLKKGNGASFYEIPEGVTVNSVTIWCKQFGAYIGSADIN